LFSQGGHIQGTGVKNEMDVSLLGEPQFDAENMTISLELEIVSAKSQNGQVDIHNTFRVDGILLDKRYAVATIETTKSESVKDSLIEKGKFVVFIVPHAGDIYIDLTTDLHLHSFGVDNAMQQQVLKTIGDALKMIPTYLQDAEQRARSRGR